MVNILITDQSVIKCEIALFWNYFRIAKKTEPDLGGIC